MRLPNVEVSSAPGIGSRVGRRIKASDCSAAALATDAICCSTRPSCASIAPSGDDSLRSGSSGPPAAPVGSRLRLAAAAGARERCRRVGVHHADPLAQLRRLAFEPEQARRDRADLLERERQRERLGRGRRRRRGPDRRIGEPVAERAARAEQAPARRPRPGRSAAGPTGSSPATGCSRRWQSSRTPCPLLQTDAASASAPRRSQAQSAPSTKSILGARGPPESAGAATVCSAQKRWRKFTLARGEMLQVVADRKRIAGGTGVRRAPAASAVGAPHTARERARQTRAGALYRVLIAGDTMKNFSLVALGAAVIVTGRVAYPVDTYHDRGDRSADRDHDRRHDRDDRRNERRERDTRPQRQRPGW